MRCRSPLRVRMGAHRARRQVRTPFVRLAFPTELRSFAKTGSEQKLEETENRSVLHRCETSCDSDSAAPAWTPNVSLGVSDLHGCRKFPNKAALCAAVDLQNECTGQADVTPASCTGTDDGAGAACALNAAEDACNVLEDGYNCVFVAATTPVCDLDANTDGTAECPAGCTTIDISTDAAAQEAACDAVPDCTYAAGSGPSDSACLWDIQAVCEAHVQTGAHGGDVTAQQEACEVDDRCAWHSDDYWTVDVDESDCTVSSNQWEDSELQDPCTGQADEIAASCTGTDDGTGAACALNAAEDACNVDGGDCDFCAATTPVCDLDANTDDIDECPAGCTTPGCAASVRNTPLLIPCLNPSFVKAGSGNTAGKLKLKRAFCRRNLRGLRSAVIQGTASTGGILAISEAALLTVA